MIDLLDLVVESLLKAASSEAGKRAVELISSGLSAVLKREDRVEAKIYN